MAKDQVKLEIVNETNKNLDKYLDSDSEIERIFGKPPPVPNNVPSNGLLNKAGDSTKLLNGNSNYEKSDTERTRQPLLEPRLDKQLPPLAGAEIDELDGDPPKDATPYPGIDDGLLEPSDKKPGIPDHDDDGEHDTEHDSGDEHHTFTTTNEGGNGTDGKLPWEHDEPDYPYGDWNTKPLSFSTNTLDHEVEVATVRSYASNTNGLGTRFGIDDRAVSPIPGVAPDVNTYQQKKNLAQGMMDLALLSANANQLRYVLESSTAHPYFYSSVIFISLSIIFQILVGVGLILNSRYDVNVHKDICKADKINNMTVIGIFLITIVNVFITSFSVATPAVVGGVPVSPRSALLMTNSSTL